MKQQSKGELSPNGAELTRSGHRAEAADEDAAPTGLDAGQETADAGKGQPLAGEESAAIAETAAASEGGVPSGGRRSRAKQASEQREKAMEQRRLRRQKQKQRPARGPWHSIWEYFLLFLGSLLIAGSFNMFFVPNQLASGGVSGISIIIQQLFGWEPAITQWAINIPLFIAGTWTLGKQFGVKTAVGSVLLPLLVFLTRNLPPLTSNVLLASIYGGMVLGIGIGIVYRGRGSTGGFSLAAQMLHKYTGIGFGICVALLDGLVIVTAGIFISPEKAMYALIGIFVTSKTINIVQVGLSYSKVAFIISDSVEEIRESILYELDRGLTKLQATGGFTGEDRTVLMVVVGQTEVNRLKELVRSIDPEAFVILSDTNEVLGEGFKLTEPA